jgi:hypothetical protein
MVLAIVVTIMTASCKPTTGHARAVFATTHTCPANRVVATQRDDLSAHDVLFGSSRPPREVATDPARLAMWRQQQAKSQASVNNRYRVFEVLGCNIHVLSACHRMKSSVSCSERDMPAGGAK